MILCINTKDQRAVIISLKQDGEVVRSLIEENEFGSQALLPLIVRLLDEVKLTLEGLTGIEVEQGPGSYTGLRVGASVAQTLGYSLNIPVNGKLNKPIELRYT